MLSQRTLRDFLSSSLGPNVPVPDGKVYLQGEIPVAHLHLLLNEYAFFWSGKVERKELVTWPWRLADEASSTLRKHGFATRQPWSVRVTCSYDQAKRGTLAELRRDVAGALRFFPVTSEEDRNRVLTEARGVSTDLLNYDPGILMAALDPLPVVYAISFSIESERRVLRIWANTEQSFLHYPEVGIAGNVPVPDFAITSFATTCSLTPGKDDLILLNNHLIENTLRYNDL